MKIYQINCDGSVYELFITPESVQEYIDDITCDLSSKYYELESECLQEADNGIIHRTLFIRNTIDIIDAPCYVQHVGTLSNYQYYQPIIINDKFQVFNSLKVRIDRNWKYRYLIEDCKERLPVVLIKKLRQDVPDTFNT